jgi:glycosyltransferase involved in cell wall biosynthesis
MALLHESTFGDRDVAWRARRPAEGLRVAIVSTSAVSTPPKQYGGTELVLAELARELAELGHEPTVFATGDSTCVGARTCVFEQPVWPPDPLAELRLESAAWHEIARGDFDVVHVNQAEALSFTSWVSVPTVATVHHDRVDSTSAHYAAYPDVAFVAISRRQAELAFEVPFHTVIHHGLDPEVYPVGRGDGGYCAFLGRFAAAKAPHLAIDAANLARVPIRLAGEPHPPERGYFARSVLPRLHEGAVWVGELDHPRKVDFLGRATALVFPIQWEEPFGLVMIEAMLVGTPVVAFACGAAPEVIDDGVTGFLVATMEELVTRLRDVRSLDRARCRAHARRRWNARRMACAYVDLYREVIASNRARDLRVRCSP